MRTLNLAKAMEKFAAVINEKRQIVGKERKAVEKINQALRAVGYQVRQTTSTEKANRRGRPVGSKNTTPKLSSAAHSINGAAKKSAVGRPKLKQIG